MAHVRRKFVDASKLAPDDPLPEEILHQIKQLYRLESGWRKQQLLPEARQKLREQQSVPILSALKERIIQIRKQVLPASAMGKTCDYALAQWAHVEIYTQHGQVEIDNNWCENAIRPIALGRKNWLHIGSKEAGEKIAAIISVIETCRRHHINVRDYLSAILPELSERPQSDLVHLTPIAWKQAHNA